MVECIKKFINYYKKPKYIIMKGIQIQNRAILFIGVDADFSREHEVKFSNHKQPYWRSNILKRIWTFKELLEWRRKLPENSSRCLAQNIITRKWENIK